MLPANYRRYLIFVILLILLALNTSITEFSVEKFGILWAPVALFLISLTIPIWLLVLSKKSNDVLSIPKPIKSSIPVEYIFGGLGMVLMLVLIPDLKDAFQSNPLPTKNSDVLQQMNHLYDRFVAGEQPYTNVTSILWKPFPVYMPMHWLPLGIGKLLNIDIRWGGFIVFVLIYIYSFFKISKYQTIGIEEVILFLLVPFVYFKYTLLYCVDNIHTVFEIIICAYYLLLALGLYLKKHWIIIVALICIMLSRYTIVFFIPLLMFVIYHRFGLKKFYSYVIYGGIGFLCLYVIPFLLREPSILQDGLAYHNKFAVSEYRRLIEGKLPAILNDGSSFMLIAKKWWQIEDPQEGIKMIRIFQVIMSFGLTVLLFLFYWMNRKTIHIFDFLLASVGLYLIFFYCTAPFAYGYYWMGFHSYLWIVCIRIVTKYKEIHPIQGIS